jgi:hypothetical protein
MMLPTAVRRIFRLRLRVLLVVVAFVGLLLTVIVQTVRLEQAAAREARLRAEANVQRAMALHAVDELFTQVANQSAAADTPSAAVRRDLLKRASRFYQGMESQDSSRVGAEARARDDGGTSRE